jgi:hypothetical protein
MEIKEILAAKETKELYGLTGTGEDGGHGIDNSRPMVPESTLLVQINLRGFGSY